MINILIYFEEDIVILAVVIGLILLAVLRFRLKASNIHIFFFSMFYIYICLLIKYTQFPIEYLPELVNRSMVFDSVNYIHVAASYTSIGGSWLFCTLSIKARSTK